MALTGTLEESLFLGAHYRHYIRLGDVIVMADSPEPRPGGAVRLVMPSDRVARCMGSKESPACNLLGSTIT